LRQFAAALPPQLTLVLPFALAYSVVKGNPCPLQAKQVLLHYAMLPATQLHINIG
jgi:hypothetical protein